MRSSSPVNLNALWFLIAANVLIYIAELITGGGVIDRNNPIVRFLGLIPASFLDQPWTILTNLFVHAGFGHIICNMISLYFLGSFLLRLVGEGKFLLVYFVGGLLGNIFYILLGPSNIPGVGASGAIFALGGALVMIAPSLRVFIIPIPIPVPLWVAMVIFLLLSFVGTGIAWQAHLGGFILGLIAGYFFRRKGRTSYF